MSKKIQPNPPFRKNLISILEKNNFNENYVKFDFRMGTVLVIFSFFWMDHIILSIPPSHISKKIDIYHKKKKLKLCRILFWSGCCSCEFLDFLNS